MAHQIEEAAVLMTSSLVENSEDRVFILTPVVWRDARRGEVTKSGVIFYFTMMIKDRSRGEVSATAVYCGDDDEMADKTRDACRTAIAIATSGKGGSLLHDCDDELTAAKIAMATWPNDRKVQRILAGMKTRAQ